VRLFVHPATTQQRMDYIRAVIAAVGDRRDEDVLSDLLTAEDTGELSRDEVEGLMMVLMMSGRDTVAYMIATMTVALLQNPDQLARLRAEPELLPTALEELLRYSTMFVTVFTRTPTEDVELEGVHLPAGRTVSVSITAANRDPARFEHPDVLDVTRDAAGHVAFGHGIHGCVGQQLARVELQEAIGALITEFPDLRLVSAEQLEPMPFANDVATYQAGSVIVAW
jgi:cytochrome P450